MPAVRVSWIFPQSGMIRLPPGRPVSPAQTRSEASNGAGTCYSVTMAKQKKPDAKGAKPTGFVVGRAGFSKISAVEGIHLTPVMKERADAGRKGLTAEEYRRTIVRSHRKS